jgi:hypothetical protein
MKSEYQRNQAAKTALTRTATPANATNKAKLTPMEKFTLMVQTTMAIAFATATTTAAKANEGWVSTSIHQRQKQGAFHAKIKEADTRSAVNFRCKKAA